MAVQVLAIYNHRLDERERRKAFILEQGLLVRKHDENKKKWGREEKELHRKIGTFSQHRLICLCQNIRSSRPFSINRTNETRHLF